MKKGILLAICGMLCLAVPAVAAVQQPVAATQQQSSGFSPVAGAYAGGFSGPGPAVVSVKEALNMWDDSFIMLRGNIVQHLGDDRYLFKDATGTIRVEIDHDQWFGQNVTPTDTVELAGELDKEWNSVEVEVKRINVIK